jgi:signal transduction histidine kinase
VTGTAAAQAGFRAQAEVTGAARRLPVGTEVVLLRVGQEALAHVRKHASARNVEVRLCYAGTTVRLTVRDDGTGFDPIKTHRRLRPRRHARPVPAGRRDGHGNREAGRRH